MVIAKTPNIFAQQQYKKYRYRDLRYIQHKTQHRYYVIPETDSPFVDGTSIVLGNDLAERSAKIRDEADSYLFFQDKIWEECGEPRYEIVTFGLGHNHGGTAMFIKYEYNHNIAKKNYFNALQRSEAIAYLNKVAEARRDTNDVGKYNDSPKRIEVLLPETVTVDPKSQHGDGDPFLNALYGITENAGSAVEAGLIAMAYTAASVRN